MQLHLVRHPGGARRQLAFLSAAILDGSLRPKTGEYLVFAHDIGGGEFHQFYRSVWDGWITLLTDGKSRHTSPSWSHSGQWLAYASMRRNGADTGLYETRPN